LTYFAVFFVAGQNPPAEANHPALLVANGKHEPPAKTVVVIADCGLRIAEFRFRGFVFLFFDFRFPPFL